MRQKTRGVVLGLVPGVVILLTTAQAALATVVIGQSIGGVKAASPAHTTAG